MYLHIGHEKIIRHKDIIGIFDIETSSVSKITRDFLSNAQNKSKIFNVTNELPKSFIVCGKTKDKSNFTVYISQISSITLLKRSSFLSDIK